MSAAAAAATAAVVVPHQTAWRRVGIAVKSWIV